MHPPYRRTPAVAEEALPFVAALACTERSGAAVLAEMTRVILAGDAPPGMRIPQEEVAAVLGVSIVPVREALKTLVGQGLVEHELRGGYTVARLTDPELQELYLVRGVRNGPRWSTRWSGHSRSTSTAPGARTTP
ncbi:GntR family transcriptional regulator [Pseudonocardia lacus]|uniref:GntR family transcriptional regulator n=1 Tax=Pseudonocardia lacus TaxID=2835865 RepID=UPI001BDD81E2|nr:GntR family transcriptional regulator [Pseudonocardia lacus]